MTPMPAARVIEQPPIVLRRIIRRQRCRGRRIEHVVDHLRAVEFAGVDDLVQRRRFADRGEAEKAGLACLPQTLEGRHDLVQHLAHPERVPAAALRNRVMQVEDIDPLEPQPRQTAVERPR